MFILNDFEGTSVGVDFCEGDLHHVMSLLANAARFDGFVIMQDLGIHESVHFLGARTDVHELLSAIDIFFLPSLWEGQPISIMEAGAAGKPVIATNIDRVADLLIDRKNALLVPVKDPNALADAMVRLIKDAGLRNRLSASIKATISESFTVEKMAKKIGDIYQEAYSIRFV